MDKSIEKDLNVTYHPNVESLVKVCDVVTINCPLHPETENMFDKKMLSLMKKGSYIVNTARGKIVDRDALVEAVKSNHIEGYAGDVWYPQVRRKKENISRFLLIFSQHRKIIHGVQCLDMQ